MPLIVSDEILQEAGLSEQEARIELACRLFDIGKLTLFSAGKLAGLNRSGIETELMKRKIPIYRPTIEDLEADLATLRRLGL